MDDLEEAVYNGQDIKRLDRSWSLNKAHQGGQAQTGYAKHGDESQRLVQEAKYNPGAMLVKCTKGQLRRYYANLCLRALKWIIEKGVGALAISG